jgi:hypothetical protein
MQTAPLKEVPSPGALQSLLAPMLGSYAWVSANSSTILGAVGVSELRDP